MSTEFSFIHAADLHLDSPFAGFGQIGDVEASVRENVLRRVRNSTFAALDNIVDQCIRHNVDFLILAGDIYDRADPGIRAQLRLKGAAEKLATRDIKVFVAAGNHDYIRPGPEHLSWPDNMYFFPPGEVHCREAVSRAGLTVEICGVSYPRRDVGENLALLFPRSRQGDFTVGVLHCNLGGIPGHENYAPCSKEDLVRAAPQYWALGHVHHRLVLRDAAPCIVYPGTTQGRNPRETGGKGCYLVRATPAGPVDLEFLPVNDVQWEEISLSIAGMQGEEDLISELDKQLAGLMSESGERPVVARITLSGRGPLHRVLRSGTAVDEILGELRWRFAGPRGNFIWPESVISYTGAPVDKDEPVRENTLLGDFLALAERAKKDPGLREELRREWAALDWKVGRYLSPPGEEEFDLLLDAAGELAVDLLWEDD